MVKTDVDHRMAALPLLQGGGDVLQDEFRLSLGQNRLYHPLVPLGVEGEMM